LNGCLVLRAGVRHGRSVLLAVQGRYPLQVTRPQTDSADGRLALVLLLLSGGLLDGDEVSIDVTLEPGARLALRTQAATQVHAGRSQQMLRASVAEGAWFSYVPQALVPHASADFRSAMEIRMARGARVLVAETLAPGRMQFAGEQFAYASVRLDLDAWCEGELVARERAVVRPDAGLRRAQFGPTFTHTASAYALGPGSAPVVTPGSSATAMECSELARGGWYMRALGRRAIDLETTLCDVQASWWREPGT